MPTPRRLADNQVLDCNGFALPLLAPKLGTGNAVLTAGAASSAAIALPGNPANGSTNVFLVSTQGPVSLRFGAAGVGAAAVDATSQMLPAAGLYLIDLGASALNTHFTHIRAGAADAIFQIIAIPTQS